MPSPSEPSLSPSDAAAAILTSDAPLPDIAAKLKLPLPDLIQILQSPDAQSLIAAIIRIDTQRADHREQRSRLTALSTLEAVCTDPASGPVEKRRAAAALLRGPGAPRAPGARNPDRQGGARQDIAHWSRSPDDSTADTEADADLGDDDGTDGASHRAPAPAPKPPPDPLDVPQLPLDATPDQVVERQLSLIQSIDKPTLTPRDIVHAIDFHRLAFPNRYYASLADAFQHKLERNPLLDIKGAQLTAEPAILHDTTPPTATVRVTIKRSRAQEAGSADAQCPVPDASSSSSLFHLIHESTFFPKLDSPHAWHTQSITRDTS